MEGRDGHVAVCYRAMVLGPFEVSRNSELLSAGRWQHRVQTLFTLLITAGDRQRRRDDLIDWLWPDADPDTASGNLRILVHRLRLALGGDPSPVISRNGWVALNPAYSWVLDLEEFETAVATAGNDPARLEAAIAMTRGEPFVENRYDDWATPLVDRATRVWREACLQLATTHKMRGRHDEAASWFERVLDADPLDEEAIRGLMVTTARMGRPADALKRYQDFRARLANDLDAEPAPETVALAESVRLQLGVEEIEGDLHARGIFGDPPETQLVGRADETERVLLHIDGVEGGSGRFVIVAGETGVGKTRFAEEIGIHLRGRGFLTAAARCYRRDQAVPFAVFLDILSQVFAATTDPIRQDAQKRWPALRLFLPYSGLPPDSTSTGDWNDQHALFRQCVAFLARVAQEQPLAILIDDLQWTDDGSLDLLTYLAREARGHRILVLALCRHDELAREHPVNQATRDMVREGVVDRVVLSRLGPEDTHVLVAEFLGTGHVPSDFSEFVYRRTRGNPSLITKLVRALGGRYRLLRQLGAGGMGRVFEAVDVQTNERVAIKLMFARTEVDPKALLRFQQEGALLAGLSHPNVVRVRSTSAEEQTSYIVMEQLEGRSLADILTDGPLPLERARTIALQILAALGAAHDRGVVHRDVKPANVMVSDGDHVTVTDFGIARLAHRGNDTSLTSTGLTLGTPLYMSPEQIHGDRIDSRADLYAVGAILYEMVTGTPPFEAEDPLAVAFMQVNHPPAPAVTRRPGLPLEWDSVIQRALTKFPADRFQSALAMSSALAEVSTEEGVPELDEMRSSVHAPQLTAPGAAATRQPRLSMSLIGVAAAAIIGAAILAPRVSLRGTHTIALHGPDAIAVDTHGHVYVSDQGNDRVVELSQSGKQTASWGTSGPGTLQFNLPGSLAIAPDGTLDVVDAANRRIEVLKGGEQVDEAQWPAGSVALDRKGDLFASDFGNYRIWEFAPGWRLLRTLSVRFINAGPEPFPAGMATDSAGDLFVADREDNRIVKLAPNGKMMASYGQYGTGSSTRGKPEFNMPSGIASDAHDRLYVADTRNNRIVTLNAGGQVSTVVPLHAWPVSIAVDGHGNVYCAEYWANKVVKISPTGHIIWTADGT